MLKINCIIIFLFFSLTCFCQDREDSALISNIEFIKNDLISKKHENYIVKFFENKYDEKKVEYIYKNTTINKLHKIWNDEGNIDLNNVSKMTKILFTNRRIKRKCFKRLFQKEEILLVNAFPPYSENGYKFKMYKITCDFIGVDLLLCYDANGVCYFIKEGYIR